MSELDKRRIAKTAGFRETSTTATKPFNLDDCPPGHDPQVWDLVLAFRRTALDRPYRIQLNAGNRLAYALLLNRISESRIRDLVEAAELRQEGSKATPQLPVWSRIIRHMMLLFLEDYITIGQESRGFEQLTNPDTWEECSAIVIRECITQDILAPDPDHPDQPRVRSRQVVRPRDARPRRDRFNGWVPDNPPRINWRKDA
jgi:hypothetical protein